MLKIRTMKYIASSRTIPSFRACPKVSRAKRRLLLDQGWMMLGYAQVLAHDTHRKWRSGMWEVNK